MDESETEEATLERLESALGRIAKVVLPGKPGDYDRRSVLQSLDQTIERLRAGLKGL